MMVPFINYPNEVRNTNAIVLDMKVLGLSMNGLFGAFLIKNT